MATTGHRIGLEQVGRHAGAIADIVTDIVGDCGRVARIVFRNPGFDLADEVAADIGALSEDTASQTGEDRDQRGAEAECHEGINDFTAGGREARNAGEEGVVERDPKERETRHEHAGDGTGLECDVEPSPQGGRGRLRRPDIGAHRHVHADEAGRSGEDRADEEADGDLQSEKIGERHEQNHADDADGSVLPAQVGLCPFRNRPGDLLHPLGAGVAFHHVVDRDDSVGDGA